MAPVFAEAFSGNGRGNVEMCRKIVALLIKDRFPPPLPFASTAAELDAILGSMSEKGIAPSIFVVNELWAEEIISRLDDIAGNVPILLFRREICQPLATFKNPHQFAEISYGSQTSDDIASRMARLLVAYSKDLDLSRFEAYAQDQMMDVLSDKTERSTRRKSGGFPAIKHT